MTIRHPVRMGRTARRTVYVLAVTRNAEAVTQ